MLDNIIVNTQSSIRISGSSVVYFDPFGIPAEPHDADYIFITHDHYDHFSPEDILKVLNRDSIMIVPISMQCKVIDFKKTVKDIITVIPGITHQQGSYVSFNTVPSYNKAKPFHPKKQGWCGYILNLDGIRYYIAGDTDNLSENYSIECDVALIPIGGTYTMNVTQAAEFVNAIKPMYAVPTHYGTIVGSNEDGLHFSCSVNPTTKVVLKLGENP